MKEVIQGWRTGRFEQSLKRAVEGLAAGSLPLAGALVHGGLVDDSDISVTVIHTGDSGRTLSARIGVFFTEVIGGCSCGDDPHTQTVWCELQVSIDKQSAEAEFSFLPGC